MSRKVVRSIPLPFPGVWVEVDADEPRRRDHSAFVGERSVPVDARLAWVHVISKHSGGEIRGYALIKGRLYLRLPDYAGEWPELDATVEEAVGAPIVPYRSTGVGGGSQFELAPPPVSS